MARDAAAPNPQAQQMAHNPAADGIKSLLLMGVFVVGMWFLLFAPQRKKAKELEATLKTLKAGDKIVTSSGILGVVPGLIGMTIEAGSASAAARLVGGRTGRTFATSAGLTGPSVLIPPELAHGVWLEFAERPVK